jgi:hypothetical protein
VPSGGYYITAIGKPPESITGVYYSTGLTILLMIVTIGIWGFLWTYRTNAAVWGCGSSCR